ncbi:MAG: hypothetical protein K2X91_01745, partial [Thermoleophilia bacterium]|nr:hypothetical protein [Thermoleophilia bacterium]
MKARVNTHALSATRFDSASLGVLGTIAHRLEKSGRHLGTIWRGESAAGRFEIAVDDDSEAAQVDLDLAHPEAAAAACCDCPPGKGGVPAGLVVRPGGYLVLYLSEGAGGFHVTLDHAPERGAEKPARVFDSRRLGAGDLFVVTLIRPGAYAMQEASGGAKGVAEVAYPKPGKTPFQPPEPVTVKLDKGRMDPPRVALAAGQGLIFAVGMEGAAISVALTQPRDE